MGKDYIYEKKPFRRPPELDGKAQRRPVVIAGGGPVGLTAALELARYGIATVILEDGDQVSDGSRAVCWAKRVLEIVDRHGVAAPMLATGFTWNTGRVFHGDREVHKFDLTSPGNQKHPAFVNLQQYYMEDYLIDAVAHQPLADLRWQNKVLDVSADGSGAKLTVETPEGQYMLACDWLIACDGARSTVRRQLGLDFKGRVFEENFLIADVKLGKPLPSSDRRFWFEPRFDKAETALCHKQANDMWRVDFQLGWNVDRDEAKKVENVVPRVRKLFGEEDVAITWASVYTFQGRRLESFRHGRVLFAGDSAHQVSPFGARGGNSGIPDAENLAWKLAYVMQGWAPDMLLDTYHDERSYAADENILISSRSTDFITPKSPASKRLRDAVLQLASRHPFAQAMINSGRLSTATIHAQSPLNFAERGITGGAPLGSTCPNPPMAANFATNTPVTHLLDVIGYRFQGLLFADREEDLAPASLDALRQAAKANPVPIETFIVSPAAIQTSGFRNLVDAGNVARQLFAAEPGTFYLIRPDQQICARWKKFDPTELGAALNHALCRR